MILGRVHRILEGVPGILEGVHRIFGGCIGYFWGKIFGGYIGYRWGGCGGGDCQFIMDSHTHTHTAFSKGRGQRGASQRGGTVVAEVDRDGRRVDTLGAWQGGQRACWKARMGWLAVWDGGQGGCGAGSSERPGGLKGMDLLSEE